MPSVLISETTSRAGNAARRGYVWFSLEVVERIHPVNRLYAEASKRAALKLSPRPHFQPVLHPS